MRNYQGKHVLITGGTHGMGFATAQMLLSAGAEVIITGSNEQRVAAAQEALGKGAVALRSDATSMADIQALAAYVKMHAGHMDLVHINVGFSLLELTAAVTEESYDKTFDINTKGAFFTAQQLAPLVKDGGAIVFTTSIANTSGYAGMATYSGAKAAVSAFMKVLAAELVPRGIRVNAVSPGFISTPTMGVSGVSATELAQFEVLGNTITPMKRHGRMEEVASAVLFLGFEATFTTGAELTVDGGLSQRLTLPS
jgi:NAD(P)-dependent dehydrogenase (short-subunit alcohol dehydrogenase family)